MNDFSCSDVLATEENMGHLEIRCAGRHVSTVGYADYDKICEAAITIDDIYHEEDPETDEAAIEIAQRVLNKLILG